MNSRPRGNVKNRAADTVGGRAAAPLGVPTSHTSALGSIVAPTGKSLYFGKDNSLYEFRRGRLVAPTWTTRNKSSYVVGDRIAVGKVNRKQLLAFIPDAELEPKAKATWGSLVLLMLGESGEEFETGYRIESIRRNGNDDWNGEIKLKPYYVDPKSGDKKYGVPITLGGTLLQNRFSDFVLGQSLSQTAEYMETAVVVMVDVGMTGGSAAAKAGLKSGLKSGVKGFAKQTLKAGLTDSSGQALVKKGLRFALHGVVKTAQAMDSLIGTAALAFINTLATELLKNADGRVDVLKVAIGEYQWPATSVVGTSGSWQINWQSAISQAIVKATAALCGKALGDALNTNAEIGAGVEKELAKYHEGSAIAHIHDFGFDLELQKLIQKWIITDNIERLINVVGGAIVEASTPAEFIPKLKEKLVGDLKQWLKSAFVSAIETLKT